MPRLLQVFGAGPWQLPVIRGAQALGHQVLVVDRDAGRPGYLEAERHERCDLTDFPGQLAIARRHQVDGLLCLTSDVGVLAAAQVAEVLDLPGIGVAAAQCFTDKGRLAEVARQAGLQHRDSWVLQAGDALPDWPGPVLCKPVDGQSGRGVRAVQRAEDLPAACAHALAHSRCGRVLLDRQVDGVEHIVDAFVDDAGVLILGIASKQPDADNPTVAQAIFYAAGERLEALLARFQPLMEALVSASGLQRGVCHAEFMLSPTGQAALIDCAARGGGAFIYAQMLPALTGIDTTAASIQSALGLPTRLQVQRREAGCIRFLRCPAGIFERFEGLQDALALPGVLAIHQAVQAGEPVGVPEHKDQRPAYVLTRAASEAEALAVAEQAMRCLRVRLQGRSGSQALH